jgi:hypothetical protein
VSDEAELRILGGNPSPEEIAALTAVLTIALDELASEQRRHGDGQESGWHRSQRAIRTPLTRGTWTSFGG